MSAELVTGTDVFIGMGSNLDNPRKQIAAACKALAQIPQTRLLKFSSWYESDPVGPPGQPNYINGAAHLQTQLEPLELLDQLQSIENAQQRKRLVHWGPRTLDLDLLLYGDRVIDSPRLQVPHPYLQERAFVVKPLTDLDPLLTLPNGVTVGTLLETIDTSGLRLLPPGSLGEMA